MAKTPVYPRNLYQQIGIFRQTSNQLFAMKNLFTLLFALALLTPALAQSTVDAREIIAKINRKETVTYQNVTIMGTLDLTELANKQQKDGDFWGSEGYRSTVEVPLTFRNCTFQKPVLAYKAVETERRLLGSNSLVYTADFTEMVLFENCTFEQESAFKYSMFRQRAVFTGSTFRDEALFKYAKFRAVADFSGANFRGIANFKYAKFNEAIAFEKSRFDRYADFKYTDFDEGVNFGKAEFDGTADFKYVHFPRNTNFEQTRFAGTTDFKYTTLGGKKFSPGR